MQVDLQGEFFAQQGMFWVHDGENTLGEPSWSGDILHGAVCVHLGTAEVLNVFSLSAPKHAFMNMIEERSW